MGISSTIPVFQFKLAATGEDVPVTQVILTGSGSDIGNDISSVSLYVDLNNDGLINDGSAFSTASFSGTTVTLTSFSPSLTINANTAVDLLAAVTTSATGVSGHTFTLSLNASTDLSYTATAVTFTSPTTNQMQFAQGQVTVTGTDITPSGLTPSSGLVGVLDLEFTTAGPAAHLVSIKVENYGTSAGTATGDDIEYVQIYATNNSGVLSDPVGTQVNLSTGPFISAEVSLPGPPTLYAGTKHYYVGYNIRPTATTTHTIGARVAQASDISTGSVGEILGTFPVPQTIADHSLPVELTSFTAEAAGQVVKLAWATESETDNLYWIVERKEASATDATYVQIHRLDGMGSTPYRTDYEFVDRSVVPGTRYAYRLTDVSRYGVRKTHDPVEVTAGAALTLSLGTAFPNPANPVTTWAYSLPAEQNVRMAVFNTLGQQVRVLVNGTMPAGVHQATWDTRDDLGRELASGVYICVLQTPTSRLLSRVTIVR